MHVIAIRILESNLALLKSLQSKLFAFDADADFSMPGSEDVDIEGVMLKARVDSTIIPRKPSSCNEFKSRKIPYHCVHRKPFRSQDQFRRASYVYVKRNCMTFKKREKRCVLTSRLQVQAFWCSFVLSVKNLKVILNNCHQSIGIGESIPSP